ncbi:MAG TPA: DUF4296 domain-containing protein [Bacteroidales bacterium]|nr:DUF4296 domain-containing protein [Bacteroidales bacterium]
MQARVKILLILFFIVSALSCTSRKSEIDRSDLIPKDKFTEIISDLYLTDGLMAQPQVHYWYTSPDSIGAYRDVIEGHGYTKEQFDKTMRFYLVRKPKEMVKIYDKAIAGLTELESKAENEVTAMQTKSSNFWKGGDPLFSPGDNGSDSTDFDITLPYWNYYTLSLTITLHPDDGSDHPQLIAYMCDADSAESGKKYYVPSIDYVKDGSPHRYTFKINDPVRTHRRLKGTLFDYANDPSAGKHFYIEDITLTY